MKGYHENFWVRMPTPLGIERYVDTETEKSSHKTY
jgi:hypothetical protein